jgi:signal transduction histidine kinase
VPGESPSQPPPDDVHHTPPTSPPRPAARDPHVAREIDAELTHYLVRQAPTGFVLGTLATAAVLAVLWQAVPRHLLLAWFVVIAVVTMPAVVVVWRFMRAREEPERTDTWQRALVVGYGLAGAGWGAVALLLYPSVAMPYQLFLLFITGAAAVSGMAALAPVRMAFAAYVTTTLLPITAVLLLERTLSSVATGMLILGFWATTLSLAAILRAALVDSLRLRYENVGLIADLSHAKDDAEAASRAKSVLLANVSHELRTPLTLILGPTRRLLRPGVVADAARHDLETVERNAQALLKHVTDLLEVAKLDAGRMEVERAPVDLAELVRRTGSLFDVVATERHVTLSVETPPSLALAGDASKLERVLLNLLSNAMKFAPDDGRVRVRLGADGASAVLSVEDTGPGVPIASRQAIFERFRRGDDPTTRRFGGTGLGLSIAKEIVERHGGRIDVGDGAEGGALFRVTLPLELPAGAGATAGAGAAPEPLDEIARQTVAELQVRPDPTVAIHGNGGHGLVLVIEDNPDMSRFLVDCLTQDHRVATAFDGRQGIEQALALKPDLILTDLMLPVIGGDALVRELRAHAELDAIPILVLTAKVDDELRVRLLRQGVQDFLGKPIAAEELCARVANFVMLKRARDVLQSALSSQSRDVATMADRLAAANRAKDEFLAILSHELRTPLMPILTWASLLRERALDAATVERGLAAIERNAKLQTRIVEDLLDVSRAITGKLRLTIQPVALDAVIRGAIDSLRPAADAKGIALDAPPAPEAGFVSGDADRLQQVVWNLLANAIKFTPRGGRVEVRVARAGDHVRLTVRDDGAGIDPALLPRLFERFWQADSSSTRAHGGLGLGLAVVRHLVELHGGTVRADSGGAGQGATFTVMLPAMALPDARDDPHPAERAITSLDGLKVMVVDDDLDTCDIIGAILESAGAEVRTCMSASQALAVMDAWVPDILVSDLAMPGDDGYALIRKVRARRTEEGGRMVAVALTAHGRSEDRAKALSAGFQMHVRKPIEPRQLVNVVATATGHAGPTRH